VDALVPMAGEKYDKVLLCHTSFSQTVRYGEQMVISHEYKNKSSGILPEGQGKSLPLIKDAKVDYTAGSFGKLTTSYL